MTVMCPKMICTGKTNPRSLISETMGSSRHSYFSCNTLFFLNQVRIFAATSLQISSLLRSRCNSNLKRGGSREVLVDISESG